MSKIATCPTCGSQSKIKEKEGIISYEAVQNDEALKKIGQLKKAMQKYKIKAEDLEEELQRITSKK